MAHDDARKGKFGMSLYTCKTCWKWCPRASIQAWTRLNFIRKHFLQICLCISAHRLAERTGRMAQLNMRTSFLAFVTCTQATQLMFLTTDGTVCCSTADCNSRAPTTILHRSELVGRYKKFLSSLFLKPPCVLKSRSYKNKGPSPRRPEGSMSKAVGSVKCREEQGCW